MLNNDVSYTDDDFAASIALARRMQEEESMNAWKMLQEACIYDQKFLSNQALTSGVKESCDSDFAFALELAQQQQVHQSVLNPNIDEMTYEEILELQEQIGDVKQSRWSDRADRVIAETCTLATCEEHKESGHNLENPCSICQCEFCSGERLLQLPCGHLFHYGCAHQWLKHHDTCCLCKASIEI